MQEQYIQSAKILRVEKFLDPKVLKYTYFDTQTGLKDSFYSHEKVNHIPNLPGCLWLIIDDNQQEKLFSNFSHRFHDWRQKEPIKFEEPLEKEIKEVETKPKKTVTKLTPQQIRKLREKGFSWQEIREFCNVSEWTIRRWKKEEEENKDKEKKPLGRPPKISGSNLSFLESCVGAFKTSTQQWISKRYSEKIGKKISQPTISRLYKKYGITEKVINYRYSEQEAFLWDIKPFTDYVKSLPKHLVIATDECAFYLNAAPRRGYGWKGERVTYSRPGNHTTRYTLMLCVHNVEKQAVISYKLIDHGKKEKRKNKKDKKKENKRGTGAVEFHDFIKNLSLPSSGKYYLLLDNAKIHHAVKTCIKAGRLPIIDLFTQMNIEPLYLVPYTPQLNPVELCFNFLVGFVEDNQPRTYEQLKSIIEEGIKILNEKNMTEYFRHCLDYDFKKTSKGFE